MTPEFSRQHRLDQIGAGETSLELSADAEERAALARRFAIRAIDRLDASLTIRRDASGVVVRGHLSGEVIQSCVVTDEPVPATIDEDFAVRFVPEGGDAGSNEEETELSEDDLDTVFYTGSAIDLGEAAAETLALALDPFPRSPNAEAALRKAGVISEEEAGPFGALAALKDKLGKKD